MTYTLFTMGTSRRNGSYGVSGGHPSVEAALERGKEHYAKWGYGHTLEIEDDVTGMVVAEAFRRQGEWNVLREATA